MMFLTFAYHETDQDGYHVFRIQPTFKGITGNINISKEAEIPRRVVIFLLMKEEAELVKEPRDPGFPNYIFLGLCEENDGQFNRFKVGDISTGNTPSKITGTISVHKDIAFATSILVDLLSDDPAVIERQKEFSRKIAVSMKTQEGSSEDSGIFGPVKQILIPIRIQKDIE